MSIKPVRVGFLFYALLAFVAFGALFACGRVPDPRADLIRSLKGADVQGYLFSLIEGDAQTTSALTNSATEKVITLGKGDTGLVLRYARVEDKKTNTSKVYKSLLLQSWQPIRWW